MTTHPDRGFTLIELLAVLVIIGIMLAGVLPAANSIVRGHNLTAALDTVEGQLSLARQTAIANNRPVEMRFYQYASAGAAGTANTFQALQAFIVNDSVFTPAERVQALPGTMIMDSGQKLSSVLSPVSPATAMAGSVSLPNIGTKYTYMTVRFNPDGSTNLPMTGGPWFLTLHDGIKGDQLTTPPADFVTIVIDPVGGSLTYFRP